MTNNKQDHIGEANKMVTAVEWLIDELIKNHGIQANLYSEFEQAKEMEKEEIAKAFDQGVIAEFTHQVSGAPETSGQEYFNQTYGDGVQ